MVGEKAAVGKVTIFFSFAQLVHVVERLVGNPTCHLQVVDMVRSELEAAGVKEEAQEKLLAGLQSAVRKSESEARQEEGRLPRPRLTAPGRNQMVSSKLTVEVAEGVAMRYVVATEDIKAGEVGGLSWK